MKVKRYPWGVVTGRGLCRKELMLQACNDSPVNVKFSARGLSKFAMRKEGKFLKRALYFVAVVFGYTIKLI